MLAIKSLSISFEFFPPKTPEGMQQLAQVAATLSTAQPQFFSVTFGAGGSTREGTLETLHLLREHTEVPVAPHLACMGLTRAQVKDMLMHYQQMGVKRLVALRGDLPSGMVQAGDLAYASELVAFARAETGEAFHIEVAAYPEFHPQALTPHEDVLNLKRKYEAGANSAITQYFFNPDAYFYYVDDCAKQGIHFPIVPGIMPITQFSRLARFSDQCGAEIPRWIRKRLEVYDNDPAAIKAFGLEVVYTLCEQLTKGGAPGLHFYTLNKSEAVAELFHLLPVTQSALALV